jgi:hypothetical protein
MEDQLGVEPSTSCITRPVPHSTDIQTTLSDMRTPSCLIHMDVRPSIATSVQIKQLAEVFIMCGLVCLGAKEGLHNKTTDSSHPAFARFCPSINFTICSTATLFNCILSCMLRCMLSASTSSCCLFSVGLLMPGPDQSGTGGGRFGLE